MLASDRCLLHRKATSPSNPTATTLPTTPPTIVPLSDWFFVGEGDDEGVVDVETEVEVDDCDSEENVDVVEELGRFVTAVDSGALSARAAIMSKLFSTVTLIYAQPGTAVETDIGYGNLISKYSQR